MVLTDVRFAKTRLTTVGSLLKRQNFSSRGTESRSGNIYFEPESCKYDAFGKSVDNELERSSPRLALGISLLDLIPERAV